MGIEFREHSDSRRGHLARTVARDLDVSTQLITRLVSGGQLEGYAQTGKTGQRVVFVYADQIPRLKALMEAQR